jgi:hypothetical protein
MDQDLSTLLSEHPDWREVLAAYAAVEEAAQAAAAEQLQAPGDDPSLDAEEENRRSGRPWAERVADVPGVDPERLAPIHGKLIAYGLLQFILEGRDAGVRYRLSTEARRLLQSAPAETTETVHHRAA